MKRHFRPNSASRLHPKQTVERIRCKLKRARISPSPLKSLAISRAYNTKSALTSEVTPVS